MSKPASTELEKMYYPPLAYGAAAVYPYKKGIMEKGLRLAKYPDENGNREFNLFRAVGPWQTDPEKARIWVPRNMVPSIQNDLRKPGVDATFTFTGKPRNSEQTRVIKETVALLKKGHSFVSRAPTGFGKTFCASGVIAELGKKTLVVVTKEDIRDQWLEAFEQFLGCKLGKEVGLIQGDTCDTVGKKLVIAMVQSLAKEERYPAWHFTDFGYVDWDECHRVGADFFANSCFRVPAMLRHGWSATPYRKDGRDEVIVAHIGPVRVWSDMAPMTPKIIVQDSGWHCPQRRKLDSEGRAIMDKDGKVVMIPIEHSAGRCGHVVRILYHNHHRNKIITNFVKQAYDAGRTTLVQSDTKEHLEMLASLFSASGIPVPEITFYVGGLTKGQRTRAKQGRVIMATYAQTKEATDIPHVDTLVMATPKSDVEQIVGRAIRFLEGKKQPLILDLRDNESPVFAAYAKARDKFYKSIGASVVAQKIAPPHIDKQGKSVTIDAFVKQK